MSALAAGDKSHIGAALFPDSDHGEIAADSRHGICVNTAAFIADQPWSDAASPQFIDDGLTSRSSPLLGTGGRQVHILRRDKSLLQQFLDCLEKGHAGALCVD